MGLIRLAKTSQPSAPKMASRLFRAEIFDEVLFFNWLCQGVEAEAAEVVRVARDFPPWSIILFIVLILFLLSLLFFICLYLSLLFLSYLPLPLFLLGLVSLLILLHSLFSASSPLTSLLSISSISPRLSSLPLPIPPFPHFPVATSPPPSPFPLPPPFLWLSEGDQRVGMHLGRVCCTCGSDLLAWL